MGGAGLVYISRGPGPKKVATGRAWVGVKSGSGVIAWLQNRGTWATLAPPGDGVKVAPVLERDPAAFTNTGLFREADPGQTFGGAVICAPGAPAGF